MQSGGKLAADGGRAAPLLWLAATAAPRIAATALAALSRLGPYHRHSPARSYEARLADNCDQLMALAEQQPLLAQAVRRLAVLYALATQDAAVLPLLVVQTLEPPVRLATDRTQTTAGSSQESIVRQLQQEAAEALAPAACHTATAAAAMPVDSQLQLHQLDASAKLLVTAARAGIDSLDDITPTAAVAMSSPERLLPAALALLSRVLDTLETAQRGQLPSLRPLEDGDFPLSTGFVILRLEKCHIEIVIGLTAMHTWHHRASERLCSSKEHQERRPLQLSRSQAAAVLRSLLQLAAKAAAPRAQPSIITVLDMAVQHGLPAAASAAGLAAHAAAATALAAHLATIWEPGRAPAAIVSQLPVAHVLLAALAALAEAVPTPVALAAAEARGGSGGGAACLRARLEVPAVVLKELKHLCQPGSIGHRLLQSKSPVQLIDRKSTEPERLLLHAGMAAKVATDLLYASALQLLSPAANQGPAAAAAALQLLTAKGALEGLQAMLRIPRQISCSFMRCSDGVDHSSQSGPLRAAQALSAAAGAAADALSDGGAPLPDDVMLAAVESATALLELAATMADEDVSALLAGKANSGAGGSRGSGGRLGSLGDSAACGEALRLSANGCGALAAILPRVRPDGRPAADAVSGAVATLGMSLAWAAGLRKAPRAAQQEILTDACDALAAAAAAHAVARKMLAADGGGEWGRLVAAMRQALPKPMWQQLRPSVAAVDAALSPPLLPPVPPSRKATMASSAR